MPFKDLLVVVDESASCAERIDVAVRLASTFEAHLTGLHVTAPPTVAPGVLAQFPREMVEMLGRIGREDAARAKALFDERLRASGAPVATEWRAVEGTAGEVVGVHSRYADLTVLGQADPDSSAGARDLPERVAMSSGRPILVVPYAGTFRTLGRRVMVAWNATREATRAVNDALPILQRAESVRVVSINPQRGRAGHGPVAGADISLHLARHDVEVEASEVTAEDMRVDDVLLSQAADAGVDLIVMGAYGHSRLGELMLGGATRHILRQITIPVFMSH
jgi:nucleotide-binding universal stress UspA family protein